MYIVVSSFKDLTDNEFEYTVGDEFPRKERNINDITKERLEELTTNKNKKRRILIKEINTEENTKPDVDESEESEIKKESKVNENENLEARGESKPDVDESEEPETNIEPKIDDKNIKAGNKSTKNKN